MNQSPSLSVAAAASTLLYQKNYGPIESEDDDDEDETEFVDDDPNYDDDIPHDDIYDPNDDDNLSEVIVAVDGKNDKVADIFELEGLHYSDDEAFLVDDNDSDSDDTCTSFPKDSNPKFINGPQKPDYSNMTESEAAAAKKKFDKERKAWTDKERLKCAKIVKSKSSSSSLFTGH